MRILFSICGIGMGHSLRSYRLMKYLSKRNHEIYVITSGDGNLFFRDKEYPLINVKSLDFEWGRGGISIERTLVKSVKDIIVFKEHYLFERYIVSKLSPDIIVSDSRGAPLLVSKAHSIPSVLITNQLSIISNKQGIDKLIAYWMPRFWSLSRKIIVPDLPPPYTITYRNNIYPLEVHLDLKRKIFFSGLLINYKDVDLSIIPSDRRIYDVFIFISAPSIDRKLYSLNMIKIARGLRGRFNTLLSLGDPTYKKIIVGLRSLEIRGWVDEPFRCLKSSRVVVLRGGQTAIMESILSAVPMIIIPAMNQTEQIENARRVSDLGLGFCISPEDFYRKPAALYNALEEMLNNYSYYERNVLKARSLLLSTGGVERAGKLIEEISS